MKVNDIVRISDRASLYIRGKAVEVERISEVSGLVTVRLLEEAGPFKAEEKLHLKPYELRDETFEETTHRKYHSAAADEHFKHKYPEERE